MGYLEGKDWEGGGKRTVPTFSRSYLELRSLDSVAGSGEVRMFWSRESMRLRFIAVGSGLAVLVEEVRTMFNRWCYVIDSDSDCSRKF